MEILPTYFSSALNDLIVREFDGNKAALAKLTGIDRAVISVLAKPSTAPTNARLDTLASALPKAEADILMVAAAKDLIPVRHHDVFGGSAEMALPDDLRTVIAHLVDQSLLDSDTASFLRTVGNWMGVLQSGEAVSFSPTDCIVFENPEERDGGFSTAL